MKICLVHEEYPEETNFGGIATYEKACAEEYIKQGHEVYVIARGLSENQSYVENGVNVFRIYTAPTGNQIQDYVNYRESVSAKLKELQDTGKIDIIEVPDWGAETVLFEPYRQVPLVVRLHTPLAVWLRFNKNNFGEVTDTMLKWEYEMLHRADLVTCCSNILKRMIVPIFHLKSRDIVVTPNPANLRDFYPMKDIEKGNNILYVGSLEERKGVCVLAKALNRVLKVYPKMQVKFIGKDTTRNNKDISTIEYIKRLVKPEYRDNLVFLGQLKNIEINKHLNEAKCCIFPSLFDNLPYVVLETMATGTPIVGSSNTGMVEMLQDSTSIHRTGVISDLANKILDTLKNKTFVQRNIDRVNYIYNTTNVCSNMVKMYDDTLIKYHSKSIGLDTLSDVLSRALGAKTKATKFTRIKGGVANDVYLVNTTNESYVIKKYNYRYDFTLSNKLYELYESNGISVSRPLNRDIIEINHCKYNVFEYLEKDSSIDCDNEFFAKVLSTPRATSLDSITILDKVQAYSDGIDKLISEEFPFYRECRYVQDIYKKLQGRECLEAKYLSHGDISNSNIISHDGKLYLIDFDETVIAPKLYDFAVITIKMFTSNGTLDVDRFREFYRYIEGLLGDNKEAYLNTIKFYLCKILLEKFYLHYTHKINLSSAHQRKDDFNVYLKLLEYFEKEEVL